MSDAKEGLTSPRSTGAGGLTPWELRTEPTVASALWVLGRRDAAAGGRRAPARVAGEAGGGRTG